MAEPPERIFKYVNPDRTDIIKNLQIRFTQPSCFNDPFEAQLAIDGLDDEALVARMVETSVLRRYRSHVLHQNSLGREPLSRDQFRQVAATRYQQAMEEFKKDPHRLRERAAARIRTFWDDVGILSLSATENDSLMWAHYANSHTGMLIEFDPKHPFFHRPERASKVDFGILVKVSYSTTRPRHRIGDIPDPTDFCVKSEEWHKEQEWRVFRLVNQSNNKVTKGTETVYLFDLPPEIVKRVVMGCRMESKKRQELQDIVCANPALRHVQIQEAKPDLDAFRLNYGPP